MKTEPLPLRVPGASAAGTHEVRAPFDDALIARVEVGGPATVEQALANAADAFADRAQWLSAELRIAILEKTAASMRDEAEELALQAAREGGKPLTDSRVEVARAIDGMKSCVEHLRTQHGREVPMNLNAASAGHLAVTRHYPVGPVVAISAFNHPLNLIVHQVAPAVAVGCPFIVKPALETPLSCLRFVNLLHEAGLPAAWGQALPLADNDLAEKLATDPRVAFLSFIGSAKVGWKLRSRLAPGTRCALEHGGTAPAIVAADADIDVIVPLLAKASFYHAGQVCVSTQRIYAEKRVARKLAEQLAQTARELKIGDPADEQIEVGPLIRAREVGRVDEWVRAAVAGGAEKLCGGERVGRQGYAGTVLFNPPPDARVTREEIFGPVVCVYPYEELDEAIARANDSPFAFQAAVFTNDLNTALRAYDRLEAAAVMINQHTAFRVDWMPFAGLKQSGHGIGGIPHTMADMQVEKLLVLKSPSLNRGN